MFRPEQSRVVLSLVVGFLVACGDSGGTMTPPPPPELVISRADPSGDNQTGPVSQALAQPLRIRATRGGAAAVGEAITWSTGAGQINGAATTGANGIATGVWTLGPNAGPMTATVGRTGGPTVTFNATATSGTGQEVRTVTLSLSGGGQFSPSAITIAPGTKVRWIWNDGPHTVTSDGPPSFPGNPAESDYPFVYEYTFTTAGVYSYHCSVHGSASAGMRGTVTVQ